MINGNTKAYEFSRSLKSGHIWFLLILERLSARSILTKQISSPNEEYEIMKTHAARGAEILSSLTGFDEVIHAGLKIIKRAL